MARQVGSPHSGCVLLMLEVERCLRALDVHAGRGEQRDPQLGQALCKWRPDRFLLAWEWTAPFVVGAKGAGKNLKLSTITSAKLWPEDEARRRAVRQELACLLGDHLPFGRGDPAAPVQDRGLAANKAGFARDRPHEVDARLE